MSERACLYGCVVVSEFAAQAMLRLRPELAGRPVVVMEGVRPHEVVCSVNGKAGSLGLRAGMTRVEVESFPKAVILQRSRSEETAARQVLAECLSLFTPRVEARSVGPAALHWECIADLSGTERLLGEPLVVGQKIVEQMRELGFVARMALCSNADAGLSHARFAAGGEHVVRVMDGRVEETLAPLPLAVLGLEAEQAERFAAWGIRTLGELAGLPELELITRMGQQGRRLRQRVRGELPHLLEPAAEAFRLEETMEFEEAVETLEPLLFCINPLLEQLILRAGTRALAIAAVTISLWIEREADHTLDGPVISAEERAEAKPFERTIRPALATVDRALLLKMVQLDLEAHPAPGSIVRLSLVAEHGDTHRIQLGLFAPPMPEPTRFEDTYARLVALVGEGNVGRVRPTDAHGRDAFVLERFKLPGPIVKAPVPRSAESVPATAMRRMRPPVEVRVWLSGREIERFLFESRRFDVLRCYGPWRSSGEWWRPEIWSFDTWDLAARAEDGELLLCAVAHDLLRNLWQMEGIYD